MGSALLHSTGQTQVISRSQEGARHNRVHTESPHYNHCPPGGDTGDTEQFQRK